MTSVYELLNELELEELPLTLNGLVDISRIKKMIKTQVLRHHPDKGGNPVLFERKFKAGKKILDIFISNTNTKNRKKTMEEYDAERLQMLKGAKINPSKMSEESFNRLWEESIGSLNSMIHERGYADAFKSENSYDKMQIVRVEDPYGFNVMDGLDATYERLGEKTSSFNSNSYSDLMEAYAEPNRESIRSTRREYRNVEELNRERDNLSFPTAEEQKQEMLRRKKKEEFENRQRLAMYNLHVKELENMTNKFMKRIKYGI